MEQQHYFGRAHDHLLIWVFLRTALRQTFHWKQKPIHQSKEFLQRNIYSLASLTWGQFQNPILFKVTLTLLKPPTRTQTFSNPSPFLLLHLNARVQEDSCKPNAIQAKKRSEVEANSLMSLTLEAFAQTRGDSDYGNLGGMDHCEIHGLKCPQNSARYHHPLRGF